jgi:hypothetical protein
MIFLCHELLMSFWRHSLGQGQIDQILVQFGKKLDDKSTKVSLALPGRENKMVN